MQSFVNKSETLPITHCVMSTVWHTWKQHPQLSSQGLRNTTNDQVSCLPGEEHTRATSIFREMDVPRLFLHLFFKLSNTQLAHTSVLLHLICSAVKNGHFFMFCLYPPPYPYTPILQFYYINAVQSHFLSEYGGFLLNAIEKTVFHLN